MAIGKKQLCYADLPANSSLVKGLARPDQIGRHGICRGRFLAGAKRGLANGQAIRWLGNSHQIGNM